MPAANGKNKKPKKARRPTHGATVSAVAKTRPGGKVVSAAARKKS